MKQTKVICLYGGPGTGKSTLAADLFAKMKQAGLSVELVREYVKNWAWEKREISQYDQFYITAKQFRAESVLYGKVDYVITDSPILLGPCYEMYFYQKHSTLAPVKDLMGLAQQFQGVRYDHFFLTRTKAYVEDGRYQTEQEALVLDGFMRHFLDANAAYIELSKEESNAAFLLKFYGISQSENLEQITNGRCHK